MDDVPHPARAAVGFTVKSGWAAAVLVTAAPPSVCVVDSRRIELSDPAIPEARQPYHHGFGTARDEGAGLNRLVDSVRQFGRESVRAVIRTYVMAGHQLEGAGIVVGSLIDPQRIANDHIRIHALEGQLFRGVVQAAAAESTLPCATWCSRDLYALAAAASGEPEPRLRAIVTRLGRAVAGSWRAEQKAAATAAWLVLARGAAVISEGHASSRA